MDKVKGRKSASSGEFYSSFITLNEIMADFSDSPLYSPELFLVSIADSSRNSDKDVPLVEGTVPSLPSFQFSLYLFNSAKMKFELHQP